MRVAVASRHGWQPDLDPKRVGGPLMHDLAAIGIAAACLLLMFGLLWALERI
jgi:type IV secretory pathway VirB2 component (pilin)